MRGHNFRPVYADLTSKPPARNPRSFFIYLLDNGVSVAEYVEHMKMPDPPSFLRYSHSLYARIWPDLWNAYVAMCALTDTTPH